MKIPFSGTSSLRAKAFKLLTYAVTIPLLMSSSVAFAADTTPPTTTITSPTEGSSVSGSITVTATATDDVGVTQLDLYVDGSFSGTSADTTSPYSFPLDTALLANGAHTLMTTAFDAAGNASFSPIVNITSTNVPDTTPPTAAVTSPTDGSTVSGAVTVTANVTDNVNILEVDFFVDGAFFATSTDTSSPYSFVLDTSALSNGTHTLMAMAFDNAGNEGDSPTINFTTDNVPDTTPPTTAITSPTEGSTISGTTTVTATATDNVSISEVDLNVDGIFKGASTDTTSPYSFTLDTTGLANGTHTFTTTAFDNAGNAGDSAVVNATVDNTGGDTTAPTAAITAPADGTTISGTTPVSVTATDNIGVTKVELYANGTLMDTLTTAPYDFSFDTAILTNGSHALMAKAYDAAGNIGNSATVNVTVSNGGGGGDTTAPTTSITSPTDGTTLSGTATVTADAADNVGVTKVELYADGTLMSTDTTSPYSFTLDTTALSNGTHTLTTKAYDAAGNIGSSTTINITASNGGGGGGDTTPPTASITSLTNGSTISGLITINADATDNVGVTKVELYVDGTLMGTDTTSPYSFPLDTTTLTNGAHSFMVKAYDAAGNTSNSLLITVNNSSGGGDITPPTATITSITNGSTVSGPITVTADATDNIGVTKVEPYVDGTLMGTDTASPYSFTLDTTTLPNGLHFLMVKAYDAAGNTSSDVRITTNNPGGGSGDTTAPTTTITSPANATTLSGTATITADASDNVGVTKVELYVDGTLKGTDTTAPYTYSLDTSTLTNGSHTLMTKAYDAAGNTGSSATVTITTSSSQHGHGNGGGDDKNGNDDGNNGGHSHGGWWNNQGNGGSQGGWNQGNGQSPTLLSPAPNSTLTSNTTTLSWSNEGATCYDVAIGKYTTPETRGTPDYLWIDCTTATTATVNTLPTDGSKINVRLFSHFGGTIVTAKDFQLTSSSGTTSTTLNDNQNQGNNQSQGNGGNQGDNSQSNGNQSQGNNNQDNGNSQHNWKSGGHDN